jgi:2-oxo-4-hydroxy-4-carboxy-5-ureidoimidazoline decarboxylase
MTEELVDVAAFDGLAADAAAGLLRPACASTRWTQTMVAGRPYGTLDRLVLASDAAIAGLDWPDVDEALAAHPRIGERAPGADLESAWSRREQAAAVTAEPDVAAALRAGNLAYERRFDQVFLICATGRSAEQMLASLTARLGNDIATEQRVVRRELAAIVGLRLARTLR